MFSMFSDENLEIMNDYDCVGILLNALQTHIKEAKVVKNACMALAAMVEPNGMQLKSFSFRFILIIIHD